VGEKEAENETVSVRKQGEGDQGVMMLPDFVNRIKEEVKKQIDFIDQ